MEVKCFIWAIRLSDTGGVAKNSALDERLVAVKILGSFMAQVIGGNFLKAWNLNIALLEVL